MTTTGLDDRPSLSVWEAAVVSFVPPRKRSTARRFVRHLPLAPILLVQLLATLRLDNSAFQDEGLYLYTGHLIRNAWATGEEVYTRPETFFSGAPQIYPVLASVLDSIGGLDLARLLSAVCLVSATVALYLATNSMLDRRPGSIPGVLAGVTFAFSAPVLFVGHLATFDALSFAALAWALAISARSWNTERWWPWSVGVGVLCGFAVLVKYASAIDVPFILALPLALHRWPGPVHLKRMARCIMVALVSCVTVLGVSLVTWAAPLVQGLRFSTTQRSTIVTAEPEHLVGLVGVWAGWSYLLMVIGAVFLARSRPLLAAMLLGGSVAGPGYQVLMGEQVSLHKHVVLGLLLGAPLAGAALGGLVSRRLGVGLVGVVAWVGLMLGLVQSDKLFSAWPDTTWLARELQYSVDSMPWIRMLGDNPESLQYALRESTEPWQWAATYQGSFYYNGLSDLPAYEAALRDNYFQLVFLDGSTAMSEELMAMVVRHGFEETSTVRDPGTNHTWRVYQRFDDIPS